MKLEDVQDLEKREKRICRANLRLYPSQLKFINDNGLSITRIMDMALDELGHKTPDPSEIDKIAKEVTSTQYGRYRKTRGRGRGGKGNVPAQKKRARVRR